MNNIPLFHHSIELMKKIAVIDTVISTRTHLKNVFWPNLFVGASFQILNIQQYASGLKLGPAAILNQNPIFEIGSSYFVSGAFKTQFHPRDCANLFTPIIASMHRFTDLKTAQFSLQILDNDRFTH